MKNRWRDVEWEIKYSSFSQIKKDGATYEECRKFACEDIANNLTYISQEIPNVIELPECTDFHFLGRVYTGNDKLIPENYYRQFTDREFVAFSSINKKNVSHYGGDVFFVYDILPEDIVHIFPMDSDTKRRAIEEDELTCLPSLWLTLSDLESLTYELGTYNQITCRTKRNGEILKPFAIVVYEECNEWVQELAKQFEVSIIIIHVGDDAIRYNNDLLHDCTMLNGIAEKMDNLYGLYEVRYLHYLD